MIEKKALGRGLSALIPPKEEQVMNAQDSVMQIRIAEVKTNKYQPRTDFNEEKLKDLINSIKEKGIVQPILVRKTDFGYELIAGERRLRAVKAIGHETIPALIKDVSDLDMLEISLIENIQREELNAIEEARAFQKFITDFGFTQERISQALGKDRSTIANTMRLLSLPKSIQEHISKGEISAGHAKALLGLPTETAQVRICGLIIRKGLSVRETESIVSKKMAGIVKIEKHKSPEIKDTEAVLQQALGTRVRIFHGKKRGKIQIEYYSHDDMNRIIDILLAKKT